VKRCVHCDTPPDRRSDEGLAVGVDQLAGPELLQHIRNVHPRHEAMVQTSLQRETIPTNLLEHVRLIQRAAVEAPAAPVVDAPRRDAQARREINEDPRPAGQ